MTLSSGLAARPDCTFVGTGKGRPLDTHCGQMKTPLKRHGKQKAVLSKKKKKKIAEGGRWGEVCVLRTAWLDPVLIEQSLGLISASTHPNPIT